MKHVYKKQKTIHELIEYVQLKFNCQPMEPSALGKIFLTMAQENIRSECAYGCDVENIAFRAYWLDGREKEYKCDYGDRLFLLAELNSGYFDTNCSRLQHELIVKRGVTPTDVAERNVIFGHFQLAEKELEDDERAEK